MLGRKRKSRRAEPQAFMIPPSGTWLGNDGNWSTFAINIGSPPQGFDVLISTTRGDFVVPDPDGCSRFEQDNFPNSTECGALRGVHNSFSRGFEAEKSESWHMVSGPSIIDSLYNSSAKYGDDLVSLQIDTTNVTSQRARVASVGDGVPFWLGQIGLGPLELFPNDTSDSILQMLKASQAIPSRSYGYTAGAYYQNFGSGAPGSLILGGYDRSRMSAQNMIESFDSSLGSPYRVTIRSINVSDSFVGNGTLLPPSGSSFSIDSTVPELWLPHSLCNDFERVFNLTYNANTDRYIVSPEVHTALRESNPTVSFDLSASRMGNGTVTISLPYSSFDHVQSAPVFNGSAPYFPLRRANDSSQYTLGRTFLQEAYLMADWERHVFTVSQAVFQSPMPEPDIVTIFPVVWTPEPTPESASLSGDLGKSALAGVIVGSIIGVCVFLAILAWLQKRRKRRKTAQDTVAEYRTKELADNARYEAEVPDVAHEFASPFNMTELEAEQFVAELAAEHSEKDGSSISETPVSKVGQWPRD